MFELADLSFTIPFSLQVFPCAMSSILYQLFCMTLPCVCAMRTQVLSKHNTQKAFPLGPLQLVCAFSSLDK